MKTRDGITITALVIALVCMCEQVGRAQASVGAQCSHTSQCDRGEVMHQAEWCLADSPSSTSGHCVRLRILP